MEEDIKDWIKMLAPQKSAMSVYILRAASLVPQAAVTVAGVTHVPQVAPQRLAAQGAQRVVFVLQVSGWTGRRMICRSAS